MSRYIEHRYRCPACGKKVWRERRSLWMRSYCDATGQMVRLWRWLP